MNNNPATINPEGEYVTKEVYPVYKTRVNANMRKGPSTGHGVIRTLKKGTLVRAHAVGDWWAVDTLLAADEKFEADGYCIQRAPVNGVVTEFLELVRKADDSSDPVAEAVPDPDPILGRLLTLQTDPYTIRRTANLWNTYQSVLAPLCERYALSPSVVVGVALTESGGRGGIDSTTDKPVARFEVQQLYYKWGATNRDLFNSHFQFDNSPGGKTWTKHAWRPEASGPWRNPHESQAEEWNVINFATDIAGVIAYECASFGMFQIMGFNYRRAGYYSPREMVRAYANQSSQMTSFFRFVTADSALTTAMQRRDWETIARRYNGNNIAVYAGIIERNVLAFEQALALHRSRGGAA